MKKRLLSILLTACMVLTLLPTVAFAETTDYGIWVGTTQVTSDNAGGVTGDGISGTVTYDPSTNTLTLNNATITETNSYGYAVYRSSGDLKIDLIGSSSINIGSVTNAARDCFGIVVQDGKLSIKSATTGGSLSIVSTSTVRISDNTAISNIGILARGVLTIEDCTVAVTAGSADASYSICNGIEAIGLSIKNATLTANGGTWLSSSGRNISYGINVIGGSLSIENSTVTANGGSSIYSESYGIMTASTVNTTISDSTVTATGNNCALCFSNAPTATGLAATASTDKTGDGAADVTLDSGVYGASNTYKYVQISPAAPTLPTAGTYATDAVSGTDYVLNGITLTIKTAKGAAFWSASGTSYLSYTVKLVSSIDVSGFQWTPVGDGSNKFTGTFDGQGNTITGLTVNLNGQYAGLFGSISGATIKNVGLVGGTVSGVNTGTLVFAGGIAGLADGSTIANCYNTGTVKASCDTSDFAAGGIAGKITNYGYITNCYNTGGVSVTNDGANGYYSGGIAGFANYYSTIQNCYSTGTTSATGSNINMAYLGGIAGGVFTYGHIYKCYYLTSSVGKGIGSKYDATISNCGTFSDNGGTLTAGTETQFVWAQTLAYPATLLESLNGWVNDEASANYDTWQADSGTTNGGYPVLNAAGGSLNLTDVGCDVAAGKLTGTTTNMQYSLNDAAWQDCATDNTTGLTFAAGTVKIRQKDKTTNESTIITIAAAVTSNTPTLESKTSGSVTLTAMTGYEYSKDGGVTWQNSNSFSGLSSSTTYSFVARIKATTTTLPGTVSTALSVTTSSASSGDGTTASTGAPVIVDGKTQNIGTEKKSGDTTIVTVDQSKLGTNIGGAASGSSVVVPVSENGSATASLVVKNIEDMAQKGMTLTVQTGNVAYNLNTAAIDTTALAAAFPGADMNTVPFNVTIQNSSVSVEGETLVLAPVEFTVTATHNGQTVSVDTFSAYIDRVIEVTAEQAAKITTAVVVNADGSVRHVPTNVIEKDGKYYAVINSLTNSTYALIQNEVTFADAKGKWYEAAVNEMGSRKIIEGRSAAAFDGEASITRAEFAAILIRALGLPADGASTFSDVPADAWYTGAVATAAQYGIVAGKSDNQYDPNANITRQEAMLMLQRAAALTEFTGASSTLDSFTDADSVGSWALDAARWSVGSGLIQGSDGKLNPTANITRAESATVILRLLQKAELVDVRS